uniref:Uncharacterized protein n=1 Tax=Panagrolaimus sp. ES5 TaxID=591445 RepID=A0AC34FGX5_9BILA
MSSSFGIIFLIIAIFQVLTTTINAQQQDVTSDVRNDENTEFAFAVGNDDEALTDQICGTHPLKTIVKKIENSQPDMDQQAVIRLLALMRLRAPKMWNSYQQMLAAYMNCKVMSAGGSLG